MPGLFSAETRRILGLLDGGHSESYGEEKISSSTDDRRLRQRR